MKTPTLAALFLLLSTACNRQQDLSPEVARNLLRAGENSAELEKVIAHYQAPEDSLKRKAALFLIANMDDLVHIDSATLHPYNRVIGLYDSLLSSGIIRHETDKQYPQIDQTWHSITVKTGQPGERIGYAEDLQTIQAHYLIDNIERAFRVWKTKPWASNLTFEQLCEYVLPYRFGVNPPDAWRNVLERQYAWVEDSLRNPNSSLEACILMCEHLKWFIYNPQLWERKGFAPYGVTNLLKAKAGNCANKVNLNIYAMRANGIAVTTDYVPGWANRNWGHSWNAFVADNGRFLDFEAFAERTGWGGRMTNRLAGGPRMARAIVSSPSRPEK